ncbi:hypothetical protein PG991_009641 [Apiospora marii]|uniref:Uncharacterized protein n=1 Tax=Apiospora marii TaxID=335849 RepID=A0ABR1RG69_9PEZI
MSEELDGFLLPSIQLLKPYAVPAAAAPSLASHAAHLPRLAVHPDISQSRRRRRQLLGDRQRHAGWRRGVPPLCPHDELREVGELGQGVHERDQHLDLPLRLGDTGDDGVHREVAGGGVAAELEVDHAQGQRETRAVAVFRAVAVAVAFVFDVRNSLVFFQFPPFPPLQRQQQRHQLEIPDLLPPKRDGQPPRKRPVVDGAQRLPDVGHEGRGREAAQARARGRVEEGPERDAAAVLDPVVDLQVGRVPGHVDVLDVHALEGGQVDQLAQAGLVHGEDAGAAVQLAQGEGSRRDEAVVFVFLFVAVGSLGVLARELFEEAPVVVVALAVRGAGDGVDGEGQAQLAEAGGLGQQPGKPAGPARDVIVDVVHGELNQAREAREVLGAVQPAVLLGRRLVLVLLPGRDAQAQQAPGRVLGVLDAELADVLGRRLQGGEGSRG